WGGGWGWWRKVSDTPCAMVAGMGRLVGVSDTWQAPRHRTWQAPRHRTWQAPRHRTWQAPRHRTWQAPRHRTWQAPRCHTWQAPRCRTCQHSGAAPGKVPGCRARLDGAGVFQVGDLPRAVAQDFAQYVV